MAIHGLLHTRRGQTTSGMPKNWTASPIAAEDRHVAVRPGVGHRHVEQQTEHRNLKVRTEQRHWVLVRPMSEHMHGDHR